MSALVSLLAISTPFSLASATNSAFSMLFRSVLGACSSTALASASGADTSAFLAGAFFLTGVFTCVPAAAFASNTALATSLA